MDKKHLFVTDLDGTLLNADSKVSQESAEIISSLSREGALITVATARTPATVEPLLCETATSIPAIVMTGAAMWDRKEKRYIGPRVCHLGNDYRHYAPLCAKQNKSFYICIACRRISHDCLSQRNTHQCRTTLCRRPARPTVKAFLPRLHPVC